MKKTTLDTGQTLYMHNKHSDKLHCYSNNCLPFNFVCPSGILLASQPLPEDCPTCILHTHSVSSVLTNVSHANEIKLYTLHTCIQISWVPPLENYHFASVYNETETKNFIGILTNKNGYLSCTFVFSTLGTEQRYKDV